MIFICEPQCSQMEHMEVNAALLFAYLKAFPEEKIVFWAEEEHFHFVKKRLEEKAKEFLKNIEFQPIKIPVRNYSSLRRFPAELKIMQQVFSYVQEKKPSQVIFFSVTAPTLLLLKFFIRKINFIPFFVIMHGIFSTATKKFPSLTPGEFLFFFRWIFLLRNRSNLFYIALSPSIRKEFLSLFPDLEDRIKDIYLPYFFDLPQRKNLNPEKITFGYLGAVGGFKQAPLYFELAQKIKAKWKERVEFPLVGYIVNPVIRNSIKDFITLYTEDKPLSREEYAKYAKNLDYVLFLHHPEKYRFLASGAFLDAISYGIPVIALRNPFFESYFDLLGNIGYLCENKEEIEKKVEAILSKPPVEEYSQQQENIYQNRNKITIEKTASLLKRYYENWKKGNKLCES